MAQNTVGCASFVLHICIPSGQPTAAYCCCSASLTYCTLILLSVLCCNPASLWLCTFSLAVAVGAALLLPISIASNEVLILYPNSYYVKWLNSSLIQGMCARPLHQKTPQHDNIMWFLFCFLTTGLWNYVFLFSNLALFVLLPFSYLFTESSGFSGHKKGIMARVYETFTVFSLLAFIVFATTYVISALRDPDRNTFQALFSKCSACSQPHWLTCLHCLI